MALGPAGWQVDSEYRRLPSAHEHALPCLPPGPRSTFFRTLALYRLTILAF